MEIQKELMCISRKRMYDRTEKPWKGNWNQNVLMNSGSVELTPYDQAKRYNDNLPYNEKARWIIHQ